MPMTDPLGDMLTRIRNAQMRGRSSVTTPQSKLRASVLDVLAEEGYIRGYAVVEKTARPRRSRSSSNISTASPSSKRSSASPNPAAASIRR
jgi:ribosomal protein S8